MFICVFVCANHSDQPTEATPNCGLVRESTQNPLDSSFGIWNCSSLRRFVYLCMYLHKIINISGQIIATSHDLGPQNCGVVKEILFQGNPGW